MAFTAEEACAFCVGVAPSYLQHLRDAHREIAFTASAFADASRSGREDTVKVETCDVPYMNISLTCIKSQLAYLGVGDDKGVLDLLICIIQLCMLLLKDMATFSRKNTGLRPSSGSRQNNGWIGSNTDSRLGSPETRL